MYVGLSAPWSRLEYVPSTSTGTSVLTWSLSADQASGNTSTSEDPEKSSRVNRANSAPLRLEICRLIDVTTQASVIGSGVHVPSSATRCVAKISASARNGSSGWPET